MYKRRYSMGVGSPKLYGLPQIDKKDTQRPIAPSRGSYLWVAKELARILRPLTGKFPYYIKNIQDFVEQV